MNRSCFEQCLCVQQAAVGELLNCSAGSDDAFDCEPAHAPAPASAPAPAPLPPHTLHADMASADGTIVGKEHFQFLTW